VELRRCGFDVRTIDPKIANSTLVVINAAVSRAAGFPQDAGIVDLTSTNFPPALAELSLDELLGLILAVGSLGRAQPKQSTRFAPACFR
jgi:hypothetical protein